MGGRGSWRPRTRGVGPPHGGAAGCRRVTITGGLCPPPPPPPKPTPVWSVETFSECASQSARIHTDTYNTCVRYTVRHTAGVDPIFAFDIVKCPKKRDALTPGLTRGVGCGTVRSVLIR